jgi:hypothetical protein
MLLTSFLVTNFSHFIRGYFDKGSFCLKFPFFGEKKKMAQKHILKSPQLLAISKGAFIRFSSFIFGTSSNMAKYTYG